MECAGAKFSHQNDLGKLDPAIILGKKRPKNQFPATSGAGYW